METTLYDGDFSAVYSRNIARVYRICYLRLQNRADAEDAAQNVFLRCLRQEKTFRDAEHEKAYFIVCAQNEAKNAAKNYWRTHRTALDEIPEPSVQEQQPSEAVQLLLALPPKYREVLYLYYFEGYSTGEIARLLRRTETTVRTHLARGRARLRLDLEGNYENWEGNYEKHP